MAGAPQGNQGDNSYGIIWTIAAVFAGLFGIWYVFKVQIVTFYLTFKLFELDALSYLGRLVSHPYYFDALRQAIVTARVNVKNVNFTDLALLGGSVGEWLRWPFVVLMLVLAVVVYASNTTRVFRRTYNMRDLAKLEVKNWPQITPILNLDLIKTDIDVGPWAMAMTPMQFCKKNKLLEEVKMQRREGMSRKDMGKVDVILKRGEANRIFAMQLGPLWAGPDKLPPYARALFAAFAARINADSKPAATLLMQLAASSASKQLNLTGVDELLKKHIDSKAVRQVTQSHAYASTMMAAMLQGSRDDGVQASSDFLWLKPIDRRLWYTLNTVGRQTPFVEVAGIFAHWVAEREAGRKLMVPMVEEATNAVESALKDVVYRPDEP